jgi:hypothetical protein
MTLQQIKTFIIGVLKGWFTNKSVLDKFSESEEGELLFDSKAIGGTQEEITEEQMNQAIQDTITDLNSTEE